MNSLIEDTLLSSYCNKLVNNFISEFTNLVLLVKRIDDRIRKRKTMDVGARMFEKKENMLDGHTERQDNEDLVQLRNS